MPDRALACFVMESNAIEGIHREPTDEELEAHLRFLAGDVSVEALERFVSVVQPGAALRRRPGMNVRVGSYVAPGGGPDIEPALRYVLRAGWSPWQRHVEYERLHPFMDGNGRSGRVLWLHDMGGLERVPLGFLHTFYYRTLRETGSPPAAIESSPVDPGELEFLEFKHTVLNPLIRHGQSGAKEPMQLNERQSVLAAKYLAMGKGDG